MDETVPQKNQETPKPNGEPASIGGRPESRLEAGGNILEGFQAATATPAETTRSPVDAATIANLHKDRPIPNLRTFESDAAEAVQKYSVSTVSIAAQKIREPHQTEPSENENGENSGTLKKILTVIGIIVLIAASVMAVGYALIVSRPKTAPATQSSSSKNSLIRVDDVKIASLNPQENVFTAFTRTKDSLATEKGAVVQVIFTATGTTTPLDSATFLNDTQAKNMPAWFTRATGPEFVAGFYHNANDWNPFLILAVSSYEDAFAAMIQWENTITTDFASFYQKPTNVLTTPTSNAPSSTTAPVVLSSSLAWSDVFIANKNVRSFGIPGQKPLFLYSFPTQNVLVISTSPEAMTEIFNRLVASQFVR